MNTSAAIAVCCYDEPSVGGFATRTLNVRLGSGSLLLGACPRFGSGTGTAEDGGASPLGSARRSRDTAQRFLDEQPHPYISGAEH